MKKLFSLALLSLMAMFVKAGVKTDVIPGSLTLTAEYTQQVLECESGAAWIVVLKNDGSGPQCKASNNSGIGTKTSIGKVKKVSVEWGGKSNENLLVYGSHKSLVSSEEAPVEIGVIEFSANSVSTFDVEGDWEYIAMTSTANKGKACAFVEIQVTWEVEGGNEEKDPQEGLVVNEVCGNDGTADDGSEDWIEIANASDHAISLEGLSVVKVDEDGAEEVLYTTSETDDVKELKVGEFKVLQRTVHFSAGISNSKNIIIKLVSAKENVVDKFDKRAALSDNGHHLAGGSYSRIPDFSGKWAAVQNATKGAANDATPIAVVLKRFQRVSAPTELVDGMQFILVNETGNNAFAMSSSWSTTKDGAVYQLAETIEQLDCETPLVDADINRVAVCTLEDAGKGKWGIHFGETGNYLNEDRYLACTAFKNLDFKKSIDKKGVACEISFNEGGDAEISWGAETAGSLKFNYKGDGTDRFLNYDPTDKPQDHLAIFIYKLCDGGTAIESIASDPTPNNLFFNLNGQLVTSPANAVVIQNGKKILVK